MKTLAFILLMPMLHLPLCGCTHSRDTDAELSSEHLKTGYSTAFYRCKRLDGMPNAKELIVELARIQRKLGVVGIKAADKNISLRHYQCTLEDRVAMFVAAEDVAFSDGSSAINVSVYRQFPNGGKTVGDNHVAEIQKHIEARYKGQVSIRTRTLETLAPNTDFETHEESLQRLLEPSNAPH